MRYTIVVGMLLLPLAGHLRGAEPDQLSVSPGAWLKLSPLADTPASPRLGYEGVCVWDSKHRVIIRYGGHNQGGGGEQGSEIWTFDPFKARWKLHETNTSPPGICCGQQNVFDPVTARYVRFPAFSGSHGWQWFREIYLNDASVWTYDLSTNTWRNMRPFPTTSPRPLRCAAWDSDHQVVVLFGGEGSSEGTIVYDPFANNWTRMKPKVQPAFRSAGNMAYDAYHKRHVLFGAQFKDDPHTWTYDLRRNEWRDMKPKSMPPTNRNDAVLTYDPAGRKVLAVVKITTGKDEAAKHRLETWAYDTGKNEWTKLDPPAEPSPSSNRARQFMFALELNVAFLENVTKSKPGPREQQVWAYRYASATRSENLPPAPPTKLTVSTTGDGAKLTWQPSTSPNINFFTVLRGTGKQPWMVDYAPVAKVGAKDPSKVGAVLHSFRDKNLAPGTTYHYAVAAVDQNGRTSRATAKVRTQPPLVEDVVVSVLSPTRVDLAWKAPPGDDIVGYHVERAVVEIYTNDQLRRIKSQTPPLERPSVGALRRVGRFIRMTKLPVKETSYSDTAVNLSKPAKVEGESVYDRRFHPEQYDEDGKTYHLGVYAYRVRAVNRLGTLGGASPAVLTIPSSPQHVFSREEAKTCHVKWRANPERNIVGYRVYRMDGRFSSAKIRRLTAEPVSATTFSDPQAGTSSRRYYVVAVDALGQEGFPSAPVWFNREWKQFYEPFTGPWHQ